MNGILPVFRRSLRESWRSVLGWTAGIAAVLALYLPLYPSLGGSAQLQDLISALPKELVETIGYDQISSGAGYTQSTFYGLMGFLLLTIAAVVWGSAALAGAEESGRAELDLAHGIGRVRYALESALSVLLRLLWLGAFSGLMVWALNGPAQLDLEPARIVGASAALTGLAFLTASAALLAGAATGRRVWATGVGAGIAVLGYILQALAKQSSDIEWLNALSPYAWVYRQSPLTEGVDAGGLALVWASATALAAASAIALRARDLRG
ncbi:ABC transporter permease subunit [Microbacterium hydrocarbonoxydans]|uniref:ABC transporter permease subunit n=1 Tax=Microbacterium hydrocarbonoxydans TaxID=273678 RepID=UPI00203E78BC|nr:ABC transporter permease subunit [Microbacterium hydrocarbonoxydans]MCM3778475.1 ABC transporter permease subunit [Microbacterium hydrocarbonoxydans]